MELSRRHTLTDPDRDDNDVPVYFMGHSALYKEVVHVVEVAGLVLYTAWIIKGVIEFS
jgi:hypothetical protein